MNYVPTMNRTKLANLKFLGPSFFFSLISGTRFIDSKPSMRKKKSKSTGGPKLEALTVFCYPPDFKH
jgi:hypothetical protein